MADKATLEKMSKQLIEDAKDFLIKRGHVNTKKLLNSFTFEIKVSANEITSTIYWAEHGKYVDKGVPANRVAFSIRPRGQGRGGTSKLITALEEWVKDRGFRPSKTIKKPLDAAFAIARSAKTKEGFSSAKSRRFSKDRKRNMIVKDTIKQSEPKLVIILEQEYGKTLQLQLNDLISEINTDIQA